MNLPNPSHSSPDNDKPTESNHVAPQQSSVVKLVFNGSCFVPSDSTEVGKTLLHHLKGRSDNKPYSIIFSTAYDAELVRTNGTKISNTAIKVGGFIIGPNPGGDPTVLELLSDKREKIRLPVLVVSESWKVLDSRIGWNAPLIKAIKQIKNGSSIVSFKDPGIFLVFSGSEDPSVIKFPVQIVKARITSDGFVKEASSADGCIYKPTKAQLNLEELTLPLPTESPVDSPSDGEEYTLAPLDPHAQPVTKSNNPLSGHSLLHSPTENQSSDKPHHDTRTELRNSRIELALCRLFQRELLSASAAKKPHFIELLADATKYQKDKSDPLTFTFKFLALGSISSAKTKIVVDSIDRWQRHHQERNLFAELLWPQYYEDLTTISPLLFRISDEIARFSEAEVSEKRTKKKGV